MRAVEMGPYAMIYIQTFINTGSAIKKLIWGGNTDSTAII
jgi:hypothetical protein